MNDNKTLFRVIALLNCFDVNNPELTLQTIAERSGIPVSTVYRILSTLSKRDFIERNPETRRYSIGRGLYTLGTLYLNTTGLIKAAAPIARHLNMLTGEVTNIGILNGTNAMVILRHESRNQPRFPVQVGTMHPAYASAVGKAILSQLSDEEIDQLYPSDNLIKLTQKTISTRLELKEELLKIRNTGLSINSEENFRGVQSFASVVRNAVGGTVAALSISVMISTCSEEYASKLSELVRLGATLVSYRLGYVDRNNKILNIEEITTWWEQHK